VRLPDGKQATREYVIHPGAVMVVAELPDGRLVLERQFRYPVQAVMVEFPAGKLDPAKTRWPAPGANCSKKPGTPPASGRVPVSCTRSSLTPPNSSTSGLRVT